MPKENYESPDIRAFIRETMADPYGRTFLLLVYLRDLDKFSGYYLTPFGESGQKTLFQNFADFEREVQLLVKNVLEKDQRGQLVRCCERWIEEGLPEHADYVILFNINDYMVWTGRVLFGKVRTECTFHSKSELTKLLKQSGKKP